LKTFTGQQEVDISECNSVTTKLLPRKFTYGKLLFISRLTLQAKVEAFFISFCIISSLFKYEIMNVTPIVPKSRTKFSATFQGMFGIFRRLSYFEFIHYTIFHRTHVEKKNVLEVCLAQVRN